MAISLKNYSFTNLGDFSAKKALDDDFVHDNLETYKFKATSTKGSKIDIKSQVNVVKEKDAFKIGVKDEIKLVVPINKYYLGLKTWREGRLTAQFDGGEVEV